MSLRLAVGGGAAVDEGPGEWVRTNEYMKAEARAYQERESGVSSDQAYVVKGANGDVKFDGFVRDAGSGDMVLLDAKGGPGYSSFFRRDGTLTDVGLNKVFPKLMGQASRQAEAAAETGTPIVWRFADERWVSVLNEQFARYDIGITVQWGPR